MAENPNPERTGRKKNFWMTLNLLVGREWKRNVTEEISEWLDSVDKKATSGAETHQNNTPQQSPSSSQTKQSTKSTSKKKSTGKVQLPKVECSFNHPKIRSKLERLMGSNLVRLTDRKYMLQLHDRILEDYVNSMNKRISEREARERDREKDLVLSGKIPLNQAPEEMANHPVLLINAYCQKLIEERRAKIKVHQVHIPMFLYADDTPDPLPGLSIKEGHGLPGVPDATCLPPSVELAYTDDDDVQRDYMLPPEIFDGKKKYESPQVQLLAEVETVEEMYRLADEIIGPLKTMDSSSADKK